MMFIDATDAYDNCAIKPSKTWASRLKQAERLLKDDAVEFIADRCDLVDEGAEAFVQVWKGSPLEYRRLLSRSPRMFVRALAGFAVQLASVSSVREIADRVMDAWERSYIALK